MIFPSVTPQQRKVLVASSLGNILEWYDFALFGFFAPILAQLFFPSDDHLASLLSTFGVFAAGFLMRPLGGALFGHLGDTVGRKIAIAASVISMAIPTTLLGLLPTHAQVGILAPLLLTGLRLIQGLSVGGELTGSISFLVEHSPPSQRGFFGSWASNSIGMGLLLGSAVGALMTSLLSPDDLARWGWRVPFLLGSLVGGVGLYLRLKMEEPESFQQLQQAGVLSPTPLREALTGYWREIISTALATWILAVGYYMIFVYLTTYLSSETHIPLGSALELNTISMIVMLGLVPIMGILSDRFGRKPLLITGCIGMIVLAYPLFVMLSQESIPLDLLGQLGFALFLTMVWGPFPAMLVEQFPTRVRVTGISLGYNLGWALFGGTTPLLATYLIKETGSKLIPSVYLITSGIVSLVTFLKLRETYRKPLQ